MRVTLVSLVFLISSLCFSEIVSVPGFNYSIYPLEGWSIQDYESDSNLKWLSKENDVALVIKSWTGDKYTDLNTMLTSLAGDYYIKGDCVFFNYIGYEIYMGEVLMEINNTLHKGWFLLVNGEDYDYFLVSYSLLDVYLEKFNEIQSVLDSFSIGNDGELNPGPISTFLNNSPTRVLNNYPVDFFGYNLDIEASEYDFECSRSIIEREAAIMTNYSNDPENFYKAWVRYYKIIFRDNYSKMEVIYRALEPYLRENSEYELSEKIMFWLQTFSYERTQETGSDLVNPLEASVYRVGDCDTRSLIMGILLHKFGIDTLLLTSEKVKHALLAVDLPGDGATYDYKGKKYLTVELTAKMLIGEISSNHADPKLWTPVEMEYSNGF